MAHTLIALTIQDSTEYCKDFKLTHTLNRILLERKIFFCEDNLFLFISNMKNKLPDCVKFGLLTEKLNV